MHGPMNVKFPNNTSKCQMGFNSAFKGLTVLTMRNDSDKFGRENFFFSFENHTVYAIM